MASTFYVVLDQIRKLMDLYALPVIYVFVTSSSAWLRRQSSPKITQWLIIGSVIFWSLYAMHALIGYGSNPSGCYPSPGTIYSLFASIDAIMTAVLSLVIMIIFSILTLHNLRLNSIRRIQPSIMQHTLVTVPERQRRSKRNTQFLRLSLLQVLVFIILNSGWTVFAIFSAVSKPATLGLFNTILLVSFLQGFGITLLYIYGTVCIVIEERKN
ncbi:unnamed protein product [Adineta steineri]|uniref:G-protein coupled receptors family 1 profile domain-containing protein n=1 Tax=Adineta steineri TaxID=433720 RepID=A0A815PYQ7_9BILA|nr:unnamed protein product [Adineta steineri]CAF1455505.1 unnamed protein product [Adineta steineri]